MSAPEPQPAEGDEEAEEAVEDSPFDGTESVGEQIDVALADTNIGEDVHEGARDERADDGGGGSGGDGRERERAEYDPFAGDERTEWDAGGFDGAAAEEFEEAVDTDEDIAEVINEGAARLAVVGLRDEYVLDGQVKTKEDFEAEFADVFEKFRLGNFGSEVAQEYLFVDETVDPLWGFAASLMVCSAVVVWMRPDGDELVDKLRNVGPSGGGSEEPAEPYEPPAEPEQSVEEPVEMEGD